MDAIIFKNRKHPRLTSTAWLTLPFVHSRMRNEGKINPASDLFRALAVCDEYRAQVLEVVNL